MATFWFDTYAMLFSPLGVLLVIKTLEDEWSIDIEAYKFTVFYHILCVRAIPTYRIYRLYDESKPFVITH